jgi:hypothetical protein
VDDRDRLVERFNLSRSILDIRLPAIDARGLLAKLQVGVDHFDQVANEVHINCLGVSSVICGISNIEKNNPNP